MKVKVADEVWIATALLHTEQPGRRSFKVREIVDRAYLEHLTEQLRPGVQVHASLHCVANKRPNPGNYRMLYDVGAGERRLCRASDDFHPYRQGGKYIPNAGEIPEKYHPLLRWYERDYNKGEEISPSLGVEV